MLVLLLQNNPLLLAQKGIRPIPALDQGSEGMDSKETLGKILQERNKSTSSWSHEVNSRGQTFLAIYQKKNHMQT